MQYKVMCEPWDETYIPEDDDYAFGPVEPFEWQSFGNEDEAITEARFMDGSERYWVQDDSGYVYWPEAESWTWPGTAETLV